MCIAFEKQLETFCLWFTFIKKKSRVNPRRVNSPTRLWVSNQLQMKNVSLINWCVGGAQKAAHGSIRLVEKPNGQKRSEMGKLGYELKWQHSSLIFVQEENSTAMRFTRDKFGRRNRHRRIYYGYFYCAGSFFCMPKSSSSRGSCLGTG